MRSLLKVTTNLALLLALLFNDQQLVLYRHQRKRGMSVPSDKEASGSSLEESSDELGKQELLSKLDNKFSKLRNFKASSEIDMKLLSGIFGSEETPLDPEA